MKKNLKTLAALFLAVALLLGTVGVATGEDTFTVTFNLNYEGAPEPATTTVESGKTVKAPRKTNKTVYLASPDEKYSYDYEKANFDAWYTEPECVNEYDFSAPVTADMTLYAGYGPSTYAFEAELTDLSGKTGFGYSISYNDEQMIRYDSPERNQNARMGFSVGYLYAEDLSLEFLIYSDRAVENVTLKARLSAEFRDIYIAPEQVTLGPDTYYSFQFLVNEESAEYEPIALTGAKAGECMTSAPLTNGPSARPCPSRRAGTRSCCGWPIPMSLSPPSTPWPPWWIPCI